jgi:hypothetical protein
LLAEHRPWQQGDVDARPPPSDHSRRPIGDWVLHAPQHLRALVRADDVGLGVLSVIVGIGAGVGVVIINLVVAVMHTHLFALPPGQGLSQSLHVSPIRAFAVPVLGGAVLGVSMWALAFARPRNLIDPVEANALYGGRVSLNDSLIVAGQTAWSNGVGASVGLEAGMRSSVRASPRAWAVVSACGAATCGCWWAPGRRPPSPARSMRRCAGRSMASS